ncbi:hypothetical protein PQR37_20550 [Paraburkholderia nemoris]|uniref:hypothetical protein n=1 Tax=Paraburkholderia nemoris TaxID=2793076 RepID=UPI0006B44668|nr:MULTISPECIES: hypothetical protein [Paraburkholderia]KPD18308.1 hypothetical protein ADM96_12865 [Burkholderia sp. ST111]MBK5146858.1 hypothetical protein [Burkholderia sp. R-69608]MBK3779540.1 hypothetical protein [Paraburkholderia aspalathi]CAE6692217.1 hypothetical protein R75461_00286 [Paraburkholderia nemoris]CAE6870455.1 hypothetical protein R69608_00869 [Paraburkholderia nemoris]
MKLRLLMALASAALFLAPSTAGALDSQQGQAVSGQALMQNANESAQATTDMSFGDTARTVMPAGQAVQSVSYGGVAAGATEVGGRQERPCASGPQCRIYFGQ